jgi:alkylation response protein AidB-like acyl-CoA dehydrogenase
MSIDLLPSEDQLTLARAVHEILARRLPAPAEFSHGHEPFPDEGWSLIVDAGWLTLAVPEELGGIGAGIAEEALMLVEAGRSLIPGPLRSTLLAVKVAAAAGAEHVLEQLLDGSVRAGLLVADGRVLDGRRGDLAVELTAGGASLHRITRIEPLDAVDATSRLGSAELGEAVAEAPGPWLAAGRILAAAEMLGIVEELTRISADYARTRVQFGKPIGTFQAVKHRCAAMVVSGYAIRAQLHMAAVQFDAGADDAAFHAAAAFLLAAARSRVTAEDAIQNFGGIGFTWEHPAHFYLTRAVLLGRAFGSATDVAAVLVAPRHHPFD